MADENNPFADVNPFAAPTAQQKPTAGGLDDYNPFADQQAAPPAPAAAAQPPPVYQPTPSYTPATIEPTRDDPVAAPYQYNQSDAQMKMRQEELEKKAQELQRREAELATMQNQVDGQKNFPPLPKFCCVKPCFYHDINVEVPIESQRTCRMIFYVWELYVFILLYNNICSLALMVTGGDGGASTFFLSLLWTFLFSPCSFLCWYRPAYKAFKNNSSFNYMVFFVILAAQCCATTIFGLGFGACGWINAAGQVSANKGVAVMMFICAALFTVATILQAILLKKVHATYRNSGASFQKAQGEFARDVMSNKNVQNAAAEAVKGGIQANAQPGANQY